MASSSGKPQSYQIVATKNAKSGTLLLLKDYLRDDLSSCSSSGFRSLPRRQFCLQPCSSSSSSCSKKSTLQKASEALLKAIKSVAIEALRRSHWLPQAKKGGVPSRSLSRRLLNRRFWRKASSKEANRNSFTCPLTEAEETEESVTTTNTCSVTTSTRDWPNEKEQFSPVSVLDCPLFDDDEEIASPFSSTSCSPLEGAKHKHTKKSQHFNGVASLKPIALEKKISRSEILQEDESIHNISAKPCSVLVSTRSAQNGNNDNVEASARDLLGLLKKSVPSICFRYEVENLVFDFFKQGILENKEIENVIKRQLCMVAEDWIRGKPKEQYLSWQVAKGREIYIKEMEKCGNWGVLDEEIQCLAKELEVEFCTSLVNELVFDLTTC